MDKARIETNAAYWNKRLRQLELAKERESGAPLCACGCGRPVNWGPGKGWSRYLKGHARRKHRKEGPAPPCKCGCGQSVGWRKGQGWNQYVKGHSRKGRTTLPDTRQKQSEAGKRRYAGKRRRDRDPTGPGVYATWEYRQAREALRGKPCSSCGTRENVHAHHRVPGDDSSLVPLCHRCHPKAHAGPGSKGKEPPPGQQAPLCGCGCGLPVSWKRVRGWARYRKGHGTAKVPGPERLREPKLCKCGCGEATQYRYGHGYADYKRGHRQRVEGHYSQRR